MINKSNFKTKVNGKAVELFTLQNINKLQVDITNYGAIVLAIKVPDKNGKTEDIVLGFDNIGDYISKNDAYFGAIIGRYANRIANGSFKLNGRIYQLVKNENNNHLHGGIKGFSSRVWLVKKIENNFIELHYLSKDSEEGYPGNLSVFVRYKLTDENALEIDYSATTDKTTPINLTHHSYFNLAGEGSQSIKNHLLKIYANSFNPINQEFIPTGEIRTVLKSPFDFRNFKSIGKEINSTNSQLIYAKGYDHNWILSKPEDKVALAAEVFEPNSGRFMQVFTNQPGIQFYTANFLDDTVIGKSGKAYNRRSAFCLETQHYPNTPNQPNFPETILKPNQKYSYSCVYKFSTRESI